MRHWGRAVIGGLLLATFGTLTFVPAFFSFMHRNDPPHRRSRSPVRRTHDRQGASSDRGRGTEHRAEGAQGERAMSANEQLRSNVTAGGGATSDARMSIHRRRQRINRHRSRGDRWCW